MKAKRVNPFEIYTGSDRLNEPQFILYLVLSVIMFSLILSSMGIIGIGLIIGLVCVLIYSFFLFNTPIIGLYTVFCLGFILLGLARYVKDVQVGLGMDGILVLTYVALIMNRFKEKVDWSPANKDITILSAIWLFYALFEIINPEARSMPAWFSGRGVFLYMMLIIPLALLLIDNNRKLDTFITIWGVFSILATMKGIMQLKFGVDRWEQGWLNEGNYKTHILFGKLRVFSFISDAGQFGANQAYTAVVAIIYSMSQKGKRKLFFIIVGILGLYGMLISGTRGSISVPLSGFMTFFVLRKNVGVLAFGVTLLLIVFIFFKFTTIGQGIDQIRRMRTAFDPNDASLQVRLENQKTLKKYLASRPFGGGIGHGGVKAQKYLPNAFLSQIATDSWYVLIWVEQGIIGLILHLFILFYTVGKASFKVMFRIRDPMIKLKMSALISGMAGVMVASYGNAVLGTLPTSVLIYTSMAVILNSEVFDSPDIGLKSEMKTI